MLRWEFEFTPTSYPLLVSPIARHETLAPAVSIGRPPCPRGSVVPVDSVPTDSAADTVPIERTHVSVTIQIQSALLALFIDGFHSTPIGIYFGGLVRVAIHIPPSLQATPVISCVISGEGVFRQRDEAAEQNHNNQRESLFFHTDFTSALSSAAKPMPARKDVGATG